MFQLGFTGDKLLMKLIEGNKGFSSFDCRSKRGIFVTKTTKNFESELVNIVGDIHEEKLIIARFNELHMLRSGCLTLVQIVQDSLERHDTTSGWLCISVEESGPSSLRCCGSRNERNESGCDRTDDGVENRLVLAHPKRIRGIESRVVCCGEGRGWTGTSAVNKPNKVVANKKGSKLHAIGKIVCVIS